MVAGHVVTMANPNRMGKLRGAGTLSKSQEKDILVNARRLRKDYSLMLPHKDPSGVFGFFDPLSSAEKALAKVSHYAEDEIKLERLSTGGDHWARAYAGTVLLSHAGKIPLVARVRTPYGDAQVAIRGNAPKDLLILAQHFDDPKLRLAGVMSMARSRGYHFFSTEQKLICTGKSKVPPEEFVDSMLDRMRMTLEEEISKPEKGGKEEGEDGGPLVHRCVHLDQKDLKGQGETPFIEIDWIPAGRTFAICRRCTKTGKNTLVLFLTHMAVPKPRDCFDIKVRQAVTCKSGCDECPLESEFPSEELMEQYIAGLGDRELIIEHAQNLARRLKEGGERVYMIEDKCYGSDLEAFIAALEPNEEEAEALKAIVPEIEGPMLISSPTASNVLNIYWKDHGMKAINAIVKDKALAKEMFERFDVHRTTPTQILKEAIIASRKRDIINVLPRYKKLPAVARFADLVARAYKTGGSGDALRAIEKYKTDDSHANAVSYAMLLAMGVDVSKGWHYTESERSFAQLLIEPAKRLLDAEPKDYHVRLQEMLRATGSTEELASPIEEK